VSLQWCGTAANSLWAANGLTADSRSTGTAFTTAANAHHDVALVNGADDNFSNPLVLSYEAGNPTDMPRVQLNVEPENSSSQPTGTTVNDGQEWGSINGLVAH
jgi:hypothetical protein